MKLAVCFTTDEMDTLTVAQRMGQAQVLSPLQTVSALQVKNGALAYVTASESFSSVQMFRQSPEGNLVIVCGVPLEQHGFLEQTLNTISSQDYLAAKRSLTSLDGAFAVVFWDNKNQKLLVVTDFLGMQPLYMMRRDRLLLLATELKAFGANGSLYINLDLAGWGAFVSFGHFIGGHTSLEAVTQVAPGSTIVYDPINGTMTSDSYWRWPESETTAKPINAYIDQAVELLLQNIRGYSEHSRSGNILLSGGFDSRLLLALIQKAGFETKAYILQHLDELHDADGRFAMRVARKLHAEYEVFSPQREHFSSEAYLNYLLRNEVATPSLYLFIAQISSFITSELQAVWEGVFPGCILVPLQKTRGGFKEYLKKACKFSDSVKWKAASWVFAKPVVEQMYEAFLQLLDQEQSRYQDDDYGVTQFVINNRTRNRTAPNPLKVYANDVLPFTPGLTKDFWNLAASIPFELKFDHRLYVQMFERHFPELNSIPFCTAGKLIKGSGGVLSYYLVAGQSRISKTRWVADTLRRVGLDFAWDQSRLVARTISQVDHEDPFLNSAAVRRLKQQKATPPGEEQLYKYARHCLFYWQIWKWMMDGSLLSKKKEILIG